MTAGEDPVGDPLGAALATHAPRTAAEAADLRRVRSRVNAGDPWLRSTPLHVTGSALIVHPPTRRILLRWHPRQQAWLQVGGHADPGEGDPLAVATREATEETGLTDLSPWPDSRLVHVVIVPVAAAPPEPAHEHADLRYVLATGSPESARPEHPTAPLRWLSIRDVATVTAESNILETLGRVGRLLDRFGRATR
jgi:8-oxo-dGTP pyrophosphatase MutT (NUDIX family)